MKNVTPLLLGLLFGVVSPGWSQGGQPLVVMECQGKIKYYAPEGKPVNVISGLLIDPEGTLKIKDGSNLQVLSGAKVVPIDQAGKVKVQDMLPTKSQGMSLGFSTDFLTMVQSTMKTSARPPGTLIGRKGAGGEETPPPTSTGRKGAGGEEVPPPTSTGKKGAGGEEIPPPTSTGKKGMGYGLSMVNWNFPLKGKIYAASDPLFFSWEGYVEGEGPWVFTIKDAKTNSEVFKKDTPDQYLSLTTIQAKLTIGNTYVWKVSNAKMPASALKAFEFTLTQESTEKGIMEAVEMEDQYQSAGLVQKLLWEAYAYEQAGFLYKADNLHKKALAMEPDNWLAVQLYSAFWGRNW
ncbi:MAG: hypothetical protein IPJ40_02310 [Saprospirales bacterium]|nr:hypothetical protein [Saprospirales bacterium]